MKLPVLYSRLRVAAPAVAVFLVLALYQGAASAQYICATCWLARERPLSELVGATGDIALIAECVSVQPLHPERYYLRQRQAVKLALVLAISEKLTSNFLLTGELPNLAAYEGELREALRILTLDLQPRQDYAEDDDKGTTGYRIKWIARGDVALRPGEIIYVSNELLGTPGKSDLITGERKLHGIEWCVLKELDSETVNYIQELPSYQSPPAQRLPYFLRFLDSTNQQIECDASLELQMADFADLERLKDQLPIGKLRQWIADPNQNSSRLGLYGKLLGICGDDGDARLMEARILMQTDEFRYGIDGVMMGYLLLKQETGLDVLERRFFDDKEQPFSETFAAMQALRMMWADGKGRIGVDRMKKSMRTLLDRPELTDLVVADLMRWKDWSVQDEVMKLYGESDYDTPVVKRAIVRYLLASTKDVPAREGDSLTGHVLNGQKLLEELRKKDPKTVSEAERFFVVP